MPAPMQTRDELTHIIREAQRLEQAARVAEHQAIAEQAAARQIMQDALDRWPLS